MVRNSVLALANAGEQADADDATQAPEGFDAGGSRAGGE
jgi:hypothetical protein